MAYYYVLLAASDSSVVKQILVVYGKIASSVLAFEVSSKVKWYVIE